MRDAPGSLRLKKHVLRTLVASELQRVAGGTYVCTRVCATDPDTECNVNCCGTGYPTGTDTCTTYTTTFCDTNCGCI